MLYPRFQDWSWYQFLPRYMQVNIIVVIWAHFLFILFPSTGVEVLSPEEAPSVILHWKDQGLFACIGFISFKPKVCEDGNAFCLISEANKRHPTDKSLDLSSFFQYNVMTSFKYHFLHAKGGSLPYWLRGKLLQRLSKDFQNQINMERLSKTAASLDFDWNPYWWQQKWTIDSWPRKLWKMP